MDTRLLKQKIYNKCLEVQLGKIHHLESAMDEAEKSADEYGQTSDVFDSHKMQLIGNRDMYAQQLQIEISQMETLNKLDLSVNHRVVEFGSVVKTSLQNVFIAVGLGKLAVDSEIYFAISLKVPFFKAMKGLKAGDSFDFMGKRVQIMDIF